MATDLRNDYDEKCEVSGGTLYRKGGTVQVWWTQWGPETWALDDSAWGRRQARSNYRRMREMFA